MRELWIILVLVGAIIVLVTFVGLLWGLAGSVFGAIFAGILAS